MPYAVRKVPNKSCYKVYNKTTKRVFAKCTSKNRAKKQLRLLRAIDYNPKFVLKNKTRRKGR
jgi:hypothetical protein